MESNNNSTIEEARLIGYPLAIKNKQIKKALNQSEKSVCKILAKGKTGTGFLCLIPHPVLITNNHILDEESIKEGKEIEISFNNEKIFKTIKIDKNR